MKRVYLDHAATTPVLDEVLKEMLPYFNVEFYNPSSITSSGIKVKEKIEEAREKVSALINAKPEEIIFTSGGTEANNMAIIGLSLANIKRGKHIIISRAEHHSVLNAARYLQKWFDFKVSFVSLNREGFVNVEELEKFITDETILVSIIHANYEIGTIEPIREISEVIKDKNENIIFHTDAVATAGQVEIDVNKMNVDALTLSSHTIYGPKGVGALFLKENIGIVPIIYGGIQEEGKRPGTENVPGIIGFGKACELARRDFKFRVEHYRKLRDKIINNINVEDCFLTGTRNLDKRLPNHASFIVHGIHGEAIIEMLDTYNIEASTGSVCVSKAFLASPILLSMGFSYEAAQGAVVFTVGIDNDEKDIDYLLEVFPKIVKDLRRLAPKI